MQEIDLSSYRSYIFDCDGVLLNSNRIKTKAFYTTAIPYGEAEANAFVQYHVRNGGISRYLKFEYFLKVIVGKKLQHNELEALLDKYAEETKAGLMRCEIACGLERLRKSLPHSRWLVVSGGDQKELREIFSKRGIDMFFNGGIFGSPDTKSEILSRELSTFNIKKPAVFIGDSRYDYEAALKKSLDFIFVHGWSEFHGWEKYFRSKKVFAISNIEQLIKSLK